ncbi:MAG TPA: DUF3179 domain-containing (seleno)protein [Chitinophagaceae bacterium]|nr:DUF3179 domain-containing (seleno)protein [Chitinophagaceae bacterium]
MNRLLLWFGLLLLFGAEILRIYFIMPFPGSQHNETISFAYWLSNNIFWIRILGLAFVAFPLINIFKNSRRWVKIVWASVLAFYAGIFFFFNFSFEADKMFYQPKEKLFVTSATDTSNKNKLVIGVVINGEAKAYPIQIIGYHHQVRDTISNTPVMITYCTVCRTGRAFSPYVNGKLESFRLVGMDHFNAMFEDATTKSWWQQATGIAIAGPLKGTALSELPSKQLTLDVWLRQYPNSLIMQPDTSFNKDYKDLADYDKGTIKSSLEKRDSLSWKPKSWIVGVIYNHSSKAYDWNELVKKKMIQDSIAGLPIVLALEKDTASFHVYDRRVDGSVLHFQSVSNNDLLVDQNTNSTWNMDGLCIAGTLKGERLVPVQAYNEFWHSWQTFHRNAEKYVE